MDWLTLDSAAAGGESILVHNNGDIVGFVQVPAKSECL